MQQTSPLLQDIDRFLAVSRMKETTFGRKAVNDGKLVGRLRAGGDVTTRVENKIRSFIATAQTSAAA